MSKKSAKSAEMQIYKKEQFEAFLKTLKQDAYSHWREIAEAIGVDRDTIGAWKKHPRAQAVIAEGIANALAQMEIAGKKDWRMWEAKLKLLGLNPATKHEISGGTDPIVLLLDRFGVTKEVQNDRKNNESLPGSSQSSS